MQRCPLTRSIFLLHLFQKRLHILSNFILKYCRTCHDYICAHDQIDMSDTDAEKGIWALWWLDDTTMLCAFRLCNFRLARLAPSAYWKAIISEILSGFDNNSAHAVIPSRADAIRYAVEIADDGDVVLLCGKGHEKYELGIGGCRELDESKIVCDSVRAVLNRGGKQKTKGIDKNEG